MIKLFEQFNNEQETHDICKKYKITNYTINSDGSIDVVGSVNLFERNLDKLPLKFNMVSGHFIISHNRITSLDGCPKEVGGEFDCCGNNLTSLLGGPEFVELNYDCSGNNLISLEGSPRHIKSTFRCLRNNIISLKGAPMLIDGTLDLEDKPLSIIDSSIEVKGNIYIDNTNLDWYKIKRIGLNKLKILFEHGVDYNIFNLDGSINDYRLERLFKDFNI